MFEIQSVKCLLALIMLRCSVAGYFPCIKATSNQSTNSTYVVLFCICCLILRCGLHLPLSVFIWITVEHCHGSCRRQALKEEPL